METALNSGYAAAHRCCPRHSSLVTSSPSDCTYKPARCVLVVARRNHMMNSDCCNDKDEHQGTQLRAQHHKMPHGTSSDASYYELFVSATENGRVFAQPTSYTHDKTLSRSLTSSEKMERKNYQTTIDNLIVQYSEMEHPVATTREEVLQQRVVAACLASEHTSGRAQPTESRAKRMYPPNIYPWNNFNQEVEQYIVKEGPFLLLKRLERVFYSSLTLAKTLRRNEAEEQEYLRTILDQTLQTAGIVNSISSSTKGIIGQTDLCVLNEQGEVTIICESKSTQNLLLPMMALDCKAAYDAAYAHGLSESERSPAWSNVAHPIGQLLAYMVDNNHRYGALTSATRTYFVKIQVPEDHSSANRHEVTDTVDQVQTTDVDHDATPKRARRDNSLGNFVNENEDKVFISDAWCVGEANYLRAWAYVHDLSDSTSNRQPKLKMPTSWIKSTTKQRTPDQWKNSNCSTNNEADSSSPNDVQDGLKEDGGKSVRSCNMEFGRTHKDGLHYRYVAYDDITILGVVGEGRNGGCFKVKWKGTEYAMKQFDIGRDGDEFFQNEIRAYMKLRDAWGVLVPRPIFWSESYSGGVMFLGLQLGRESRDDDDLEKFHVVLKRLEEQYGIRHNDADRGRNMIVITDCDGKDRVVAIDFEDWDDVPVKNVMLQ